MAELGRDLVEHLRRAEMVRLRVLCVLVVVGVEEEFVKQQVFSVEYHDRLAANVAVLDHDGFVLRERLVTTLYSGYREDYVPQIAFCEYHSGSHELVQRVLKPWKAEFVDGSCTPA